MKPNNITSLKTIGCIHFSHCSGCTINEQVDAPPLFEHVLHYFEEKGLLDAKLHVGEITGWRTRAKLAVRGSWENPHIGLYREKTHDVVDIPFCKTHHPAINEAIAKVRAWIQNEQIKPYDEISKKGKLRYLQASVERATNKVQLSLVLNDNDISMHWLLALEKLWNLDNLWHSLWINCNTARDNVIFSSTWKHLYGEPLLWETFCDTKICFQPASFAQANFDMFDWLLQTQPKHIPKGSAIVEYYSGSGVIGLTLVGRSRWVRCCEINPDAEFCFLQSQKYLNEENAKKISFHKGKAGDLLDLMNDADVVIVDPPRKGLDTALLKALQKNKNAHTIIYISCGWTSFQRDSEALISEGWNLSSAEAHLFFPGTNHIETLAVFKRLGSLQKPV